MMRTGSRAPVRWWFGADPIPLAWSTLYEELTEGESSKQWGLAAGLFILHHRRDHSEGPSFRALFKHLLPETQGVPSLAAEEWTRNEQQLAGHWFRHFVSVAWRRSGYIDYEPNVPSSLRPGRRLLALAQRHERIRSLAGEPASPEAESIRQAAVSASYTPAEVAVRLRITAEEVGDATASGFLHAVGVGGHDVRYPSWQFTADRNQPTLTRVDVIVRSIPTDWTLARVHRIFTSPHFSLTIDRRVHTPAQWLRRGGDPTAVAIILEGYSYDAG